jgi:hypothetical protein
MTYDAGDPKAVNKARQKAYSIDERLANGFTKMCDDPDCRFVLAAFLDQARVFHSNFHSNPTDHAFNEGFRNGGLWFLNNALLHDPLIVGKMQADKDSPLKAEGTHDRHGSTSSDDPDSDTSGE